MALKPNYYPILPCEYNIAQISCCRKVSTPEFTPSNQIYNHTFPEYLISTLPHPRRMYRHTYRPRKRKIAPKQPLLLSSVVRLITPPCYLPRIHGSTTNSPLNSNFGEPGVGRLARCFFFILNFMFEFLLNFRLVIFLNISVFMIYLYYCVYRSGLRTFIRVDVYSSV